MGVCFREKFKKKDWMWIRFKEFFTKYKELREDWTFARRKKKKRIAREDAKPQRVCPPWPRNSAGQARLRQAGGQVLRLRKMMGISNTCCYHSS